MQLYLLSCLHPCRGCSLALTDVFLSARVFVFDDKDRDMLDANSEEANPCLVHARACKCRSAGCSGPPSQSKIRLAMQCEQRTIPVFQRSWPYFFLHRRRRFILAGHAQQCDLVFPKCDGA